MLRRAKRICLRGHGLRWARLAAWPLKLASTVDPLHRGLQTVTAKVGQRARNAHDAMRSCRILVKVPSELLSS